MYINVTFILQIGNFLLTYCFLDAYFFKPFLSVLEQKKRAEQALQECLVHDEALLESLRQEKEQKLIAFQDRIQSVYLVPRDPREVDTSVAEYVCTHEDAVVAFMCIRKSITKVCDVV
jgi:hypothetical protein